MANSPRFFVLIPFCPLAKGARNRIGCAKTASFFYQALTLYREQLYLLSPQHDGDVELVPSAFIDELERVADIKTAKDDDETLFSTENFLKNYGTYVWEHSETEGLKEPTIPPTMLPTLPLIVHNIRVEKSRTVTHDDLEYEGWLSLQLVVPSQVAKRLKNDVNGPTR